MNDKANAEFICNQMRRLKNEYMEEQSSGIKQAKAVEKTQTDFQCQINEIQMVFALSIICTIVCL